MERDKVIALNKETKKQAARKERETTKEEKRRTYIYDHYGASIARNDKLYFRAKSHFDSPDISDNLYFGPRALVILDREADSASEKPVLVAMLGFGSQGTTDKNMPHIRYFATTTEVADNIASLSPVEFSNDLGYINGPQNADNLYGSSKEAYCPSSGSSQDITVERAVQVTTRPGILGFIGRGINRATVERRLDRFEEALVQVENAMYDARLNPGTAVWEANDRWVPVTA